MPKKKKTQTDKQLFCERCQRIGHLIQDCYTLICDYCKKRGHALPTCRSLQRDKNCLEGTTKQFCKKVFIRDAPLGASSEDQPSTSSGTSSNVDAEIPELTTIGTYRKYLMSPYKDVIEISASELKGLSAKMLVNRNIPISLIKMGQLKDLVNAAKEMLTLEDAFGGRVKTICLICLTMHVGTKTVLHPCRVVPDDFYIEVDGVLGYDFMMKAKVKFGEYVELADVQIPFIKNELIRGSLRGDTLIEVSSSDSDSETLIE